MAGGSLFPLPSNFFPRLELTTEEAASFQEWGDRLVQETVDAYHRDQLDSQDQKERKWKPLKQRGGLTAFRRRKSAGEDDYKYLCTGIIDGTLDEVVRGRYADDSDTYRRASAVYRDDLVDCAILHTIEAQSPARPFYYSGFKWMTVQSPGHGLVKNRDVCWYEQNGFTRDRNGKEVGYTLTESVDLPNCPTFSECVRAKVSVCYLYRKNKSGGVKVYMRGRNNAGGKVLDYIADQKSADLWLRAERTPAVTQAAVATAFIECSKRLPAAGFEKRKCDICDDRIGTLMAPVKQCAMCRRFTCARCVVKKRVLSSLVDFTAVCRETFCKKCIRYVSDVNLRDPQSLVDVWQFATSSMNDPTLRAYPRQFESDQGTDSSRDTDESREHKPRKYSNARSVDSDGSDRSFRHMPPPMIATKPTPFRQLPPQIQQPSMGSKKPSMRGNVNMTLLPPTASVYDNSGSARSHDGDAYGRHTPQYAGSATPSVSSGSSSHRGYHDQPYSSQRSNKDSADYYHDTHKPPHASQRSIKDYYEPQHKSFASDLTATTASTHSTTSSRYASSSSESETHQPLTAAALQAHHKAVGSYRSPPPPPPSTNGLVLTSAATDGYSADAMMAQMIKMNLIAEKAQAMVEQTDRVARGYQASAPTVQRY